MAKLVEIIGAAEQMVAALTANEVEVSQRGVTAEFIAAGQELVTSAKTLNQQQEELKAALKLKTKELEAVQKKLKDWQSESSTSVKLAYRKEKKKWSEFGLKAKK